MREPLPPGVGPVAVHRWFARGEDWALHPWLCDRLTGLLAALDDRIKSRREGPFQIDADGAVLVGEVLADDDCLDPLARDRRPCILRVVLVGHRLSGRARDDLLTALARLELPTSPGVSARLAVAVADGPSPAALTARRPAAGSAARRGLGVGVVAVLVLAVAIGMAVAVLWRRNAVSERRPPTGPPAEHPSLADPAGLDLLRRYHGVDHPYVAYLEAHPEAWQHGTRPSEVPSYEAWRRRQGERVFRHADRPLPRRLRERVGLWREPDESMRLLAQQMRGVRQRWLGDVEPAATPLEEVERFFEHLSRPEALPPRAELDHPANVFLWRLPADPVAAGQTFDTADDVARPLRRLLDRLRDGGALGRPQPPLDLLRELEEELDYASWLRGRRRAGDVFADVAADPGEVVTRGLRRFGAVP